jgi:hypothetical protein
MTPHEIWEAVKERLQNDLPRASYETWLRDTQGVELRDQVFVVAARNAYVRDWLSSRLSDAARDCLNEALDGKVKRVEFAVQELDEETGEEDDSEKRGQNSVEAFNLTAYRDEVHPNRIVMLDAYCLRLMEQGDLSAKELSLWVGFHQSIWAQWKTGRGRERHVVRDIPNWEITRFAMMKRTSFFRELDQRTIVDDREFIARGHVEVLPTSRDETNRYRVLTSPLISRKDLGIIRKLLQMDVESAKSREDAHKLCLEALQRLATLPTVEWIDMDIDAKPLERPGMIRDAVRLALGEEGDLGDEIINACETLYERIMSAYGKLTITHYFLQVVVPMLDLTHPQAWAIIALRDRCWYDHDTATQHEYAIVRGGADTVARWVGVTRKAFESWLTQDKFRAFVQLVDLPAEEEWGMNDGRQTDKRVFVVNHQEPMLSEALDDPATRGKLYSGKSGTLNGKKLDSLLENVGLALEKVGNALENVGLAFGKYGTPLNNLNKPLLTSLNLTKPQEDPTTSSQNDEKTPSALAAVVNSVNFSEWSLERIFKLNRVHPKTQKLLTENETTGKALVSWLLYSVSADPEAQAIQRPLGFSLDQVFNYNGQGPKEDFDRLASLPPRDLIAMLAGVGAWRGCDPDDMELFSFLMSGGLETAEGEPRYRDLLPILLGRKAIPPSERKVAVTTISKKTILAEDRRYKKPPLDRYKKALSAGESRFGRKPKRAQRYDDPTD